MEAFFGGIMLVSMGLSAFSAGMGAKEQQTQINQQTCQLVQQMYKYKKLMSQENVMLDKALVDVQRQAQDVMSNISQTKDLIRDQHNNFKHRYYTWAVAGVIFLMVLVFLFASKKFFLHATTEAETAIKGS